MEIAKNDIVCLVCPTFKFYGKVSKIDSNPFNFTLGVKTFVTELPSGNLTLQYGKEITKINEVKTGKEIDKFFKNEIKKKFILDELFYFIDDPHYDIPEKMFYNRIKEHRWRFIKFLYSLIKLLKEYTLKKLRLENHMPLKDRMLNKLSIMEDDFIIIVDNAKKD